MKELLRLDGLSKHYNQKIALDPITLQLKRGELLSIVGPNGSGKTSLLQLLVGITEPTEGKIHYFGQNFKYHVSDSKKRIGFVPDETTIADKLSGREFIFLVLGIYETTTQDYIDLANQLITLFALDKEIDNALETYSHGMIKKVQLISALAHKPDILILDEPFNGLDPEIVIILQKILLHYIQTKRGVILSTHDLHIAEKISTIVLVLDRGKKIFYGATSKLRGLSYTNTLEDSWFNILNIHNEKQLELQKVLAHF